MGKRDNEAKSAPPAMGERDNVAHSALPGMGERVNEAHSALLGWREEEYISVIGLPVTLASYYPSGSHHCSLGGPASARLTVPVNGAPLCVGGEQSPGLRRRETCG